MESNPLIFLKSTFKWNCATAYADSSSSTLALTAHVNPSVNLAAPTASGNGTISGSTVTFTALAAVDNTVAHSTVTLTYPTLSSTFLNAKVKLTSVSSDGLKNGIDSVSYTGKATWREASVGPAAVTPTGIESTQITTAGSSALVVTLDVPANTGKSLMSGDYTDTLTVAFNPGS
jgi:hypothetical protein